MHDVELVPISSESLYPPIRKSERVQADRYTPLSGNRNFGPIELDRKPGIVNKILGNGSESEIGTRIPGTLETPLSGNRIADSRKI